MKGIILAGYSGDKLHPLTLGIPKQLLPIYNKPMIYYAIETLVEVGIKDILVITEPKYLQAFVNALIPNCLYDVKFTFATQSAPEGMAQALTIGETFIQKEGVCFITGDCIILGKKRTERIKKAIRAAELSGQSTIFVSRDYYPDQYGIAKLDEKGKCKEIEGKAIDRSFYSITGLYVFPKGVSDYAKVIEKSERGRLEMTSLNQAYFEENKLQVQKLGEDFKWFDTNTHDSILKASLYIQKQV